MQEGHRAFLEHAVDFPVVRPESSTTFLLNAAISVGSVGSVGVIT